MPIRPLAPLLCIAAALAHTGVADAQASVGAAPSTSVPYVEGAATASVQLVPDRASVMVAIETPATTAVAASAANARIQRAVLDTLRAMGFADTATTTRGFRVSARTRRANGRDVRDGYIAHNLLIVHVASIGRIGDVIDAALARGATDAGNVAFASSTSDSAQIAAVALATAKARRQASTLAASLGGSLGPVLMATTHPNGDSEILGYGSGEMGEAFGTGTSLIAPPITVEASVLVRWQYLVR